jgi:hypothetical protein
LNKEVKDFEPDGCYVITWTIHAHINTNKGEREREREREDQIILDINVTQPIHFFITCCEIHVTQ